MTLTTEEYAAGDPYEGFPWQRVRAAIRYLTTTKPWWSRFAGHMKVIPIDVPAPDMVGFGAATSTDQDMNLYVDRAFALGAPVSTIAGAVELALQHHVRDHWNRLSWLDEEKWSRFANTAMNMEIVSAMEDDDEYTSMHDVRNVVAASSTMTLDELERWSITEPPGLGEFGWKPESMGLEKLRSAEHYVREIIKAYDDLDDEDSSDSGEGEGDGDSDDASTGDQPDSDSTPQQDGESDSNGDSESNQDQDSDTDGDSSDPTDDSSSDDNQDSSSDDASSESDGGGESSPQGESESETSASDATAEDSGSDDGGAEPSSADVARSMEAARHGNPVLDWYANELTRDGEDPPGWMVEDEAANETEKFDADMISRFKIELAEDIKEAMTSGWGLSPGTGLGEWADGRIKAFRGDWTTRFRKLVSGATQSAMMSGASDLSYSVRNPNQQQVGPILPGLHTYTPEIMALVDVSASVRPYLSRMFESLAGIAQSATGMGTNITWVSADTKVQAVGKATTVNTKTVEAMAVGFGGTVLSQIIKDIVSGEFAWERKRYKKPDVLIVVTDCAFMWPWRSYTRVPITGKTRIVVASVVEWERASGFMPGWVTAKDFVHIA